METLTSVNDGHVSDVRGVNELNEGRGLHLDPLTNVNDGLVSNVRGVNELNEGRALHLETLTSVNDCLVNSNTTHHKQTNKQGPGSSPPQTQITQTNIT